MAELLVRIVDKIHPDVHANATHTKRGDVIVAREDGWTWGNVERQQFAILRVDGLSVDEAEGMCSEEPGNRKVNRMLRARAFGLDLDKIGVTNPGEHSVRLEAFRAARFHKSPARDPFRFD